jgi:hypothetical protein
VAEYFFTFAERMPQADQSDEALRYYGWSKKLYLRYERLGEKARKELKTIDERTAQIEARKRNADTAGNDDDEDKVAESCS